MSDIAVGGEVVILDGRLKGRIGTVEQVSKPRPKNVQLGLSIEEQTHYLVRLRDPGKPRSWRRAEWFHGHEITTAEGTP